LNTEAKQLPLIMDRATTFLIVWFF